MQNYGLPASVVLGVAIHESAAGKSKIARYLNNHFGIKGPNSSSQIKSAYRGYPSVDSSYNHFVAFLKSRPYFNILFKKYNLYDYRSWAEGIQRGGYAASRTWAAQVIGIIQKYELFKYDNRPEGYQEDSDSYIPVSPSATSPKLRSYLVKSGDNLGRIAKRFQTTVKALMQKNGLKTTAIKPGLKLKL
ncbi:Mannosyl-glycoprotein endo-beta-N-acetylglucosaminidase [compost metagenome]